MKASDYLSEIYYETKSNLEYITEVEGVVIPQYYQDKILAPLAFAILQQKMKDL